ncbi:uncharacterized protein BYT42DRAFT_617136 [Radiomyces spectabilis]|uniref:uncharacterized protein n=1 Tax=Radiomyces spectabilis TaxID=64574 RepID=UPI00222020D9|nr:uncharacterized protein BYT42DRAFT_617136 [Radiomyces spectabilis]KAI8370595.1 hypothetical protein BYT42DRAFT_617136 [Radiomyces spectabilis]
MLPWCILVLSIQAACASRIYHTATQLPNGTIRIQGGITNLSDFTYATTDLVLHIHRDAFVHFDQYPSLPVSGQTAHWHKNALVSFFGLQSYRAPAPPISINLTDPDPLNDRQPPLRYSHTSTQINDTVYVIGGRSHQTVYGDLWKMNWKSWTLLDNHLFPQGIFGHSALAYRHWILSCFGSTQGHEQGGCTWLDTRTLLSTTAKLSTTLPPRTHATMTLVPGTHRAIVFGGRFGDTFLDDVWELDLESPLATIGCKRVGSAPQPRAAHAAVAIDDTTIMFFGGQILPLALADMHPLFWNTATQSWGPSVKVRHFVTKRELESDLVQSQASNGDGDGGLSKGAIGGIVVGILGLLGLAIGFFVWSYQQRRQARYDHSRAARFSLSPPGTSKTPASLESARHSTAHASTQRQSVHDEHPMLQLRSYDQANRASTGSFGSILGRFHRESMQAQAPPQLSLAETKQVEYVEPQEPPVAVQRQNSTGTTCSPLLTISSTDHSINPSTDLSPITKENTKEGNGIHGKKRRESLTLKQMTLNMFGSRRNSEEVDTALSAAASTNLFKRYPSTIIDGDHRVSFARRRSSLFGLRTSKLLQLPGTATHDIDAQANVRKRPSLQSRASLGAKSVASVQWVEFNNDMDYKKSWNMMTPHLAVMNPRRSMTIASSCRTSYYDGSSNSDLVPYSPSFSPDHYRLSDREAMSWGDDLVARLNDHYRQTETSSRHSGA